MALLLALKVGQGWHDLLLVFRQSPPKISTTERRTTSIIVQNRNSITLFFENPIKQEILKSLGIKSWTVYGDGVSIMYETFPEVFHFLKHSIRLEDVYDANEQKKVLAFLVFGRYTSPDIIDT